ncbi:MAG: nickel-dependent lactate racemase [Chloroflexi bacterium]|nr:nickel-dependent lactate racemase [Chloroflexota bacterium]
MIVKLAYGKTGLVVDLDDALNVTVIEPKFVPGLPDPRAALRDALRAPIQMPPLRDWVQSSDRVGIVFSDITRPTPNHLLLPAVLDEIAHVPRENITLFNALGTHRADTDAELRGMLGDALVDQYRIVQNNAFDPNTQVCLGTSAHGHEIWLNREFVECDAKIVTGFIEPHFFAGFSGGGKGIMPGMAGQRTVLGNHDAGLIGHPQSTWAVTKGNPIWEEIHEVALKVPRTLLLNVTLNKDKQITAAFAGDLLAAHAAGSAFVRETVMVPVPHPFDIVITTNSGYPLDLNLYQAVKGMSAAALVVREGGAIIVAADCWDGIPDHGLYGQLLREASSPRQLLETINAPGFLKQDQWQAQIQALIQLKADVYVRSDNLSDQQIQSAMLKSSPKIEDTLSKLVVQYGQDARICVLPEGPQTIPFICS